MRNEVQLGKNIDWVASQLTTVNSIANGSGLVLSGEPTVIGDVVGVVASTAVLSTDLIDVQHKGVFNLPVLGVGAGGNGAGVAGQQVFIDNATGLLSLNTGKILYGHTLAVVPTTVSTIVPVMLKH
jgi:predicted RecA/RadA family phage recombinase